MGRSGYATVGQTRFSGGLNLTDGVDVVGVDQAVDLMNVVFLPQGGVRQRSGYQGFTPNEITNRADSIAAFYTSSGTRQLIVGNGNRLDALNTSGVSIANVATANSPHNFTRFGAPGSEHMYIGNGTDTLRRWDGAAFTTPAFTGIVPTGKFVAVQSSDNRLVCANYPGFPDRVAFSDPGLPLSWTLNNHVDLRPGSGEAITAMVSWREYVFVFKESEFFVFYGTSADGTGKPVFNYRPASGMVGSLGAVCTSPDGVYFADRRGVWLTTGGEPRLISPQLDPLFMGGESDYYAGGIVADGTHSTMRLTYLQGRVYLAFATVTTNSRIAVYSTKDGWWTLYDIPASCMCVWRPGTREELMFGYASGLKHVGRYYETSPVVDDYTAVSSSNLVTNGTFDTVLTGWAQFVGTGSASVVGAKARQVSPGTNASEGIIQVVTTTGTAQYQLSAEVTGVVAPRSVSLQIIAKDAGAATVASTTTSFTPGAAATYTTAVLSAPATTATLQVVIAATGAGGVSTTFDIDNIVLTRVGTPVAVSSRWRQGWIDYGTQDQKWLRQTKMWGEGSASVGSARDFEVLPGRLDPVLFSSGDELWGDGTNPLILWADGSDSTRLWGPGGSASVWVLSQSISGHLLAMLIENETLGQTWALHRLEHGFHAGRGAEVLGRYGR